MDLANLRQEYRLQGLEREHLAAQPLEQFKNWLQEAQQNPHIREANAMHLATAWDNKPTMRVVLLKGIDEGLIFYTNYQSRKGQELAQNPYACISFFWEALERQVRIEGKIEKVNPQISEQYYHSRPLGSRLGALVSPQSQVIDKKDLENAFEQAQSTYSEENPPQRPQHWGGYRLVPYYFEFWQGRPSRLHDRWTYTQHEQEWIIERIAP